VNKKIIFFVMIVWVSAIAIAFGQARTIPSYRSSPFGKNITGFMQLGLGLSAMPILDLSAKSQASDTDITISDPKANFPGFTASMLLIPTWGPHGITFGVSYDLIGASFKQKIEDTQYSYTGDSKLGIADFALRAGYVYYFGEYEWHPYLLVDAGCAWETVQLESSYDNSDDVVKEGKSTTPVLGAGAGLAHEISNGILGVELRTDYYPFPLKMEFVDPTSGNDMDISHPLRIKLQFVFAIGHL
jgi:hypothetical protein